MLFAAGTSNLMFVAGVGLLIAILMRRSYRYFGRGRRNDSYIVRVPRPNDKTSENTLAASQTSDRLQIELYDFARDIKAEVDTKMRALQQLTQMASLQTDQLETAITRAERLGIVPCRDTLAKLRRVTSEPLPIEGDTTLGDLPILQPWDESVPDTDGQRQALYKLADQGYTPGLIAKRIQVPVGEVELMLSLRGN